jgi:elongation factor Ts
METVNIETIKSLRDKTNISLDACKKALIDNIDEALIILQKRGELKANELSNKATNEGLIYTYLHNYKIGVIIEVNCQTDFAAKSQEFKTFCETISLQIAAMNPKFIEDLSDEEKNKQMIIFRSQIDLSKPEHVLAKIIDGKLTKLKSEFCLLSQESVVVPGKTIDQLRAELASKIGESVVIKRFVRWEVGVE